jgi:hypothetical protein
MILINIHIYILLINLLKFKKNHKYVPVHFDDESFPYNFLKLIQ